MWDETTIWTTIRDWLGGCVLHRSILHISNPHPTHAHTQQKSAVCWESAFREKRRHTHEKNISFFRKKMRGDEKKVGGILGYDWRRLKSSNFHLQTNLADCVYHLQLPLILIRFCPFKCFSAHWESQMIIFLILSNAVVSVANYGHSIVLSSLPSSELGSCGRSARPPLGYPEWDLLESMDCRPTRVSQQCYNIC